MKTLKIVAVYAGLFGGMLFIAWSLQYCGWVS